MNHTERSAEVNANVAFEQRDLNLRALFYVGLVTIIAGVVIHAGMWWLLKLYGVSKPQPVTTLPPQPRLQLAPTQDLREKRAQAESVLNSYGWVDKHANVIHIPIEQAMKRVVERGLPITGTTQGQSAAGTQRSQPSPGGRR